MTTLLLRKVPIKTPNTSKVLDLLSNESPSIPNFPIYERKAPSRSINPSKRLFIPKDPTAFQISPVFDHARTNISSKTTDTFSNESVITVTQYDQSFSQEALHNLYAHILRSPVRMNKMDRFAYPRELLIPIGFEIWESDATESHTEASARIFEHDVQEKVKNSLDVSMIKQSRKFNNKQDPSAPPVSLNSSPNPSKQCVRVYPRYGHGLSSFAGSVSYIGLHVSSISEYLNRWVSLAYLISMNTLKITKRFLAGLSPKNQSKEGNPKRSIPVAMPSEFNPSDPKVFTCPDNLPAVIPILLVQEMEKELDKVLRNHIVRRGSKIPENTHFFRLIWDNVSNEPSISELESNPFCTQITNISNILYPAHAKQIKDFVALRNIPNLSTNNYIDIASSAGITLQTLLFKYEQYFANN